MVISEYQLVNISTLDLQRSDPGHVTHSDRVKHKVSVIIPTASSFLYIYLLFVCFFLFFLVYFNFLLNGCCLLFYYIKMYHYVRKQNKLWNQIKPIEKIIKKGSKLSAMWNWKPSYCIGFDRRRFELVL